MEIPMQIQVVGALAYLLFSDAESQTGATKWLLRVWAFLFVVSLAFMMIDKYSP